MIVGKDLDRLLYGNVLDAYSTELFGSDINRSEESKKLLERLAELNRKELLGQLTNGEHKEQRHLRKMMATSANIMETNSRNVTTP